MSLTSRRLDVDTPPPPPRPCVAPTPFLAAAGSVVLARLAVSVADGANVAWLPAVGGVSCLIVAWVLHGWSWSRDLSVVDNTLCCVFHMLNFMPRMARLHFLRDAAKIRAAANSMNAMSSVAVQGELKAGKWRECEMELVHRPPHDQEGGRDLEVRVYRPREAGDDEVLPRFILFHGGGMVIGEAAGADVAMWGAGLRRTAKWSGAALASVEYRLAPEHPFPAAPDDAWYAVQHLAQHATRLRIDSTRIVLGGLSAGANLALVGARTAVEHGVNVRGVVAAVPMVAPSMTSQSFREYGTLAALPTTIMQLWWECYSPRRAADSVDPRFNLLAGSFKGLPSAVVAVALADPFRDEGYELVRLLRRDGVPLTALRIHGSHSFGLMGDKAAEAALHCETRRLLTRAGRAPD